MKRRKYLGAFCVGAQLGLAGCSAVPGLPANRRNDADAPDTPASGVIVDGKFSEPYGKQLQLFSGQRVVVTVGAVDPGEDLFVSVGLGSRFVVQKRFFEDGREEYPIETDGIYRLQLVPRRNEEPRDADVTIYAKVRVTEWPGSTPAGSRQSRS